MTPTWLNTGVDMLLIMPSKVWPEIRGHSAVRVELLSDYALERDDFRILLLPNKVNEDVKLYVKSGPVCPKIDTVKKIYRDPFIQIPLFGEIYHELMVVDTPGPIKAVRKLRNNGF
jgi:hypothetical protein